MLVGKAICLVALCVIASAAPADTVILDDEGTVEGTIEEVVFLQQGTQKTLHRGEFSDLALDPHKTDKVVLSDGTIEKGEMVSLRIKSIGGLLTFQRAEVRSVVLSRKELDELRKEYLKKRAEIPADDGEALYRLAAWCKEKKLAAEANDLAEQCLKAGVGHETATLAHQMLGHVLRGDEWIVPLPSEKAGEDKPADGGPAKPADDPGQGKADPQQVALARTLAREYEKKAEDAKNADTEAVERTYKSTLDTLSAQLKKLKNDMDTTSRQLSKLRDDYAAEIKHGYPSGNVLTVDQLRRKERIDQLKKDIDAAQEKLRKLEDESPKVRNKYVATGHQAKTAMSQANSRAASRNQRLATARAKIERLLGLGKALSGDEMRAIFEEALKG